MNTEIISLHSLLNDRTNNNENLIFTDNNKLGILEVKVSDTPIYKEEQNISFLVDISASMSDYCNDGRSKMHHARHVIKNIINEIVNNKLNMNITIYAFDDNVEEICLLKKITQENLLEIHNNLDMKLQPRGSTDINLSLQVLNKQIKNNITENIQTNIIITDGIPTAGNTDFDLMKADIPENCYNIFIGLGSDHDEIGLQKLASAKQNGIYQYIDKIENTSLFLAEMLHNIFYIALQDITIQICNGLLYDYKSNTWNDNLYISTLTSENIKTFHFKYEFSENKKIKINIYGKNIINNNRDIRLINSILIDIENNDYYQDLTKYIHRQKVQELLFIAHDYTINNLNNHEIFNDIRIQLKDYINYIETFINTNNLIENDFYKNLYNDIYITLKTFGKRKAAMYSGSRQHSQGRQTSCNISQIDDIDNTIQNYKKLRRTSNFIKKYNSDSDNDNNYSDDDNNTTIFSLLNTTINKSNTTPKILKLMRNISTGIYNKELEINNENIDNNDREEESQIPDFLLPPSITEKKV